jgi:hypothetical protein
MSLKLFQIDLVSASFAAVENGATNVSRNVRRSIKRNPELLFYMDPAANEPDHE